MKKPNPNTIKPIDPAKVAKLGEKIGDHPNYKHRTPTAKIMGVLFFAGTLALIYLILGQSWSHWWWLLVALLAFITYICFEKQVIIGISIYDNGVVLFEDTDSLPKIFTWPELEFGETDWGKFSEIHFIERETGKYLANLDTREIQCDKEDLCSVLRSQPTESLIQFWNESLERGHSVEYGKVTLKSNGVHFKKVDQVLPYHEFDVWSVNENWEVVYRTSSGRTFEPKLFTYHIPYEESLFEFAKQQANG